MANKGYPQPKDVEGKYNSSSYDRLPCYVCGKTELNINDRIDCDAPRSTLCLTCYKGVMDGRLVLKKKVIKKNYYRISDELRRKIIRL